MRDLRVQSACLLAGALVIGMAGTLAAQERTTATYEDWVLQCEVQAGPPAQRTCDIAQVSQAQVQGKNIPFSRIAIQHPVKGQPVRLVAQLPVNVSLRANVRIQTSDSDPGLTAPFDRCVPAGCFADFDIKEDAIKKFRGATEAGKMTFKNAGGQVVTVTVSFKGFGSAFDVLAKE